VRKVADRSGVDPKPPTHGYARIMQIGEVAERSGLSFRTIRYYEEIGLVTPSARTKGGFRLFTEADVERLLLVKAVRPLRLDLEETREMLRARDAMLAGGRPSQKDISRVIAYLTFAERRLSQTREDLKSAEDAIRLLRRDLRRIPPPAD
jgi:DNA-binding transcriptional MerR regulator